MSYDEDFVAKFHQNVAEATKEIRDIVHVVRCKDCKLWISCTINLEAAEAENGDWFCASGEREDDSK